MTFARVSPPQHSSGAAGAPPDDLPTIPDAEEPSADGEPSADPPSKGKAKLKAKLVSANRKLTMVRHMSDFSLADPSTVPVFQEVTDAPSVVAPSSAAEGTEDGHMKPSIRGAKRGLAKAINKVLTMGLVSDNPFITPCTISAPGLQPNSFQIFLDTIGQHTISWACDLTLKGAKGSAEATLPPGSCNLYLFPTVTLTTGEIIKPDGKKFDALKELCVSMATDPQCDFFQTPDVVGAYPMHAILVANTDPALEAIEAIFKAAPKLLSQVHTDHRAGFPLFNGESCLHICAVNCREELLCTLLTLVVEQLPKKDAIELLSKQCSGVFFLDLPMRNYGSTVLSYACVFGLRKVVVRLLQTGYVSMNDRNSTCEVSGYMPLHAVVAHGMTDMYDWLTSMPELPTYKRAKKDQRSQVGRLSHVHNTHGLLPAQLAAKLGNHRMCKHILRTATTVLWVWGPVTQYSINLAGIDTAGAGSGDIMELLTRADAPKRTTELILDSFMTGFLYRLYVQKWRLYGWKLYYARQVCDFIVLGLLVVVAFVLKASPDNADWVRPLCVIEIVLMVALTVEELRIARLYWKANQGEGDAYIPPRAMMAQIMTFWKLHWVRPLLCSYLFTFVSCVLVLCWDLEEQPDLHALANASGSGQGRMLRGGGISTEAASTTTGSLGSFQEMVYVGDESEVQGLLWLSLFAAMSFMMPYVGFKCFTPFEKLNIFFFSVVKMLKRDLAVFLVLFAFFMLDFYFGLYVLYPRAGVVYMPQVDPFNNWYNAFRSLLELAFTGSPALINLEVDFTILSNSQSLAFALWLIVYLFFIILSLILLLNLLIAMLSFTFETVSSDATLQCRITFAQCLMRLELQAMSFNMAVNVGEKKMAGNETSYTYDFRSVSSKPVDDVDDDDAGGDDPFAIPDGGPIGRIESKLAVLEGGADDGPLARIEAKLDALEEQMGKMRPGPVQSLLQTEF